MKKFVFAIGTAIIATFFSCGSERKTTPTEGMPVVDVTANYPAKTLTLQEIADVEYVPLETREKFFVEGIYPKYMDDEIVIFSNSQEDILIFDRHTGKGISSFNRKGRGPSEYIFVGSLAVDKAAGEIFVRDANNLPVHVYDMQGKPLRTLNLKRNLGGMFFFHDWDDEHLFFYNPARPDQPNAAPYTLLSKTDTLTTDLPIRLDGREGMSIKVDFPNGGYMTRSAGTQLAKTHDGYMISEPGLDTMFTWNKGTGELTPVMARTPSFHSMEYPVVLFYMGESSDYMFLQTIERKWEFDGMSEDMIKRTALSKDFKRVNLARNKADGSIYETKVLNGDFVDEREIVLQPNFATPAGQYVYTLQPYELLELNEAGKLQGSLAELVPTLREDDNPVMMVVTLK
jgi:hypothetical protein